MEWTDWVKYIGIGIFLLVIIFGIIGAVWLG